MDSILQQLVHQAGVQELDIKDIEKAVSCNVDAYEGYSLYPALFGKCSSDKLVAKVWRSSILTLHGDALLLVDGHDVNGFLCVCPPGYHGMPAVKYLLRSGLKNIMPISTYLPMVQYERYCMDMKDRNMPQDGWYVYDLVVRQNMQHKGLAKRMLQPFLNYLDVTKQSVYLETHEERNVPFYNHFGFSVAETGHVPHSNLSHFGMVRMPK